MYLSEPYIRHFHYRKALTMNAFPLRRKESEAVQIKVTTDYAIRCVLYLANAKKCCSTWQIGESMGVPEKYAHSILHKLRAAGIVASVRGGGGGYVLCKQPENITLLEITVAMERTFRISRCLEDDGSCNINGIQKHCPIYVFYTSLQKSLTDELGKTTIRDLLKNTSPESDYWGEETR